MAEETTATPESDRIAFLIGAMRDWGGEWTVRRVQQLYRARYGSGLYRHQARADLDSLVETGLLSADEGAAEQRVYRQSNSQAAYAPDAEQ